MNPGGLMQGRIRFLLGVVGLAIAALIVQLVRVQFGPYAPVFAARSKWSAAQLEKVVPARGLIYDRNGKLLATNGSMFYLEIEVRQLTETSRYQIASVMSKLLVLPFEDLYGQLITDWASQGQYRIRLTRKQADGSSLPITVDKTVADVLDGFLADPEAPDLSGLRQWMVPSVQAHSLASLVLPSLAAIDMALLIGDELDAWLDGFGDSEAEDLLLEGLGRGMHILAAGAAAEVVGSWAWSPRGEEYVGALGWLPGAIVMTGEAATADWGSSRSVLARRRRAYALALARGNMVGLGPRGELRLSGDPAPRLLLGPGWGAAEEGAARRPSSLERP